MNISLQERLKAGDIGRVLHPERVVGRGRHRHKPTFTTRFGSIPDGVMPHQGVADPVVLLKWKSRVWAGHRKVSRKTPQVDQGQGVEVLIPSSVVEVVWAGWAWVGRT